VTTAVFFLLVVSLSHFSPAGLIGDLNQAERQVCAQDDCRKPKAYLRLGYIVTYSIYIHAHYRQRESGAGDDDD